MPREVQTARGRLVLDTFDEIRVVPRSSARAGQPVPAPSRMRDATMAEEVEGLVERGYLYVPADTVASAEESAADAIAESGREVYASSDGRLLVDSGNVIVRLREELDAEQSAAILEQRGLRVLEALPFSPQVYRVRGGGATLDLVESLRFDPTFAWVEPELLEQIVPLQAPDPVLSAQWQWGVVHAGDAWSHTRGANTIVAVIDVGFEFEHPDITGTFDPNLTGCFIHPPGAPQPSFNRGVAAVPRHPHGSFCAALAVGRANAAGGVGIAPEATLFPIACFGDHLGSQAMLATALTYAVAPRNAQGVLMRGADVISISVGARGADWELSFGLRDAINAVVSFQTRGCPIFWAVANAAFNVARNAVVSLPTVFAVSRSTRLEQYGNAAFGAPLDFVAPGVDLVFSTAQGLAVTDTGTSFATPIVAGVAALLRSLRPQLSVDQIGQILRGTAERIGPPGTIYDSVGHNDLFGFGRVDAARAIAALLT